MVDGYSNILIVAWSLKRISSINIISMTLLDKAKKTIYKMKNQSHKTIVYKNPEHYALGRTPVAR